jgi:hypothetical protein
MIVVTLIAQFAAAAVIFKAVESIAAKSFIGGWIGGAFCMQVVQWIGEAAR